MGSVCPDVDLLGTERHHRVFQRTTDHGSERVLHCRFQDQQPPRQTDSRDTTPDGRIFCTALRSKALFEQALHDREDTVYAQQTGNGRGWKYTVESVNRWLDKIPESIRRLDLEGLQGVRRQQVIDQWYAQEQQALQAQTPAPEGEALTLLQKQLDDLEQQRSMLQKVQ